MATIMLCSQTTDTSIELYWDDGRLRSRHGAGAAPAVHIPVVEKFVGRLAATRRQEVGHHPRIPVLNRPEEIEKTMPEKHSFHHLPLRKLGFEYVPAVPVDIPRMADTLVRLGIKTKTKQYEQTLQGLSRTYTIRGTTARAYLRRPCGRRSGW
jgi:hypothetical protein